MSTLFILYYLNKRVNANGDDRRLPWIIASGGRLDLMQGRGVLAEGSE